MHGLSEDYPIRDGIPRFVGTDPDYNPMWDFKWTVLDGGRGYNYDQILERGSAAFKLHNVFQFLKTKKGCLITWAVGWRRTSDAGPANTPFPCSKKVSNGYTP